MNKKTLVSCFVSLVILGGGTVAYSSFSSAQEVAGGGEATDFYDRSFFRER